MKVALTSLASAKIRPQHLSHLDIWLTCPKQPYTIHTRAAEFWTRAQVAEQFVEIQGTKIPVQETLTSPFHKLQIATCTERAEPLPYPVLTTILSIWSINNWRETSAAAGGRFCAQLSSSSVSPCSPCADLFSQPFSKKQADKVGEKKKKKSKCPGWTSLPSPK